jgi:hypothetical protein
LRRLTLSDGKNFVYALSIQKPEIHALMQEKKEGMKNAIASATVTEAITSNSGQKWPLLQTLTIVQEGVSKIGEPKKYEPKEGAASSSLEPDLLRTVQKVQTACIYLYRDQPFSDTRCVCTSIEARGGFVVVNCMSF